MFIGANHCVLRTAKGQIITFGAHKSGQLGRRPTPIENNGVSTAKEWFAEPKIVNFKFFFLRFKKNFFLSFL